MSRRRKQAFWLTADAHDGRVYFAGRLRLYASRLIAGGDWR